MFLVCSEGSANAQLTIMETGSSVVRINDKYSNAFKAMSRFPVDVLPEQSCIGLIDVLEPITMTLMSGGRCTVQSADSNNMTLYHISGSDYTSVPFARCSIFNIKYIYVSRCVSSLVWWFCIWTLHKVIKKHPSFLKEVSQQSAAWRQMEDYLKMPYAFVLLLIRLI